MSVTMNDSKMTASCVALLAFLKELKVETSKALNKDESKLLEKIEIAMQMAITMDDRWNNTGTSDEWLNHYKERIVELEKTIEKVAMERDEANRKVQQLVVERDEANRKVQQLVVETKNHIASLELSIPALVEEELRTIITKKSQQLQEENELLKIRLSELQYEYQAYLILNKAQFSHCISLSKM